MGRRGFGRRPSPSLVISLLALLVASSGWGYAATGGNFILGKENKAAAPTRLTSGAKHGPTFALKNTGGQAAASFSVKRGVAPFSVGSDAKVKKLNADSLDGSDASGFYAAGSKVADADKIDGVDSSGFYKAGSKVADADKLDGLDSTALQKRVKGTCTSGSAMQVVNADGTVTCQTFPTTGFSGYEIVQNGPVPLAANSTVIVRATCPAGKSVLGGGGHHASGVGFVANIGSSFPIETNQWQVAFKNPTSSPAGVWAYAVCATTS